MESVWQATAKAESFSSLQGDIKTDVLIIGGGLVGVLTAYFLDKAGIDYVLAEAKEIGSGITKNTTAKITSQHGLIYSNLIGRFGEEKALMYLKANEWALCKYKELCKNIDCDFEEKDAFVYSIKDRGKIEAELTALSLLGLNAEFIDDIPLPLDIAGAIKFSNQAQFNPLKFISKIAKGLKIYEHTIVRELKEHTAVCTNGKIHANKIICATHFPFINKHGAYWLKLYQHRSYVIALKNAPNVGGMYVDEALNGMSFRNYNGLLLIGGGDHRTGKQGGNWRELRSFAKLNYPEAKEKFHWATQDCMSLDGVPYIGRYSKATHNFYVATGFNKWGMTTSMAAAKILCDMVAGNDNQYAGVFSPSRTIMRPQLAVNAFEAVTNLLTPATKRCPHLGCALKWNSAEHTWDCPCHGSRFTENGGLIDNPSTGNAKWSGGD